LSAEGKLVLAGPFDGVDGWRGLFIFAVDDIDEARQLVATDPVVAKGEMVAEFHKYYGTAALMLLRDLYEKVAQKPM
jgi:YCII-related domain